MLAKERFAWIWLTALVIVLGLYFAALNAMHYVNPDLSFLARIGMLAIALGTLGVIAFATWLYGHLRERDELAEDERDRFIEWRSSRIGYYALMAGVLYVGMVMPFTQHGWDIVHSALAVVAIAEIVRSSIIVLGYRRGWHA